MKLYERTKSSYRSINRNNIAKDEFRTNKIRKSSESDLLSTQLKKHKIQSKKFLMENSPTNKSQMDSARLFTKSESVHTEGAHKIATKVYNLLNFFIIDEIHSIK